VLLRKLHAPAHPAQPFFSLHLDEVAAVGGLGSAGGFDKVVNAGEGVQVEQPEYPLFAFPFENARPPHIRPLCMTTAEKNRNQSEMIEIQRFPCKHRGMKSKERVLRAFGRQPGLPDRMPLQFDLCRTLIEAFAKKLGITADYALSYYEDLTYRISANEIRTALGSDCVVVGGTVRSGFVPEPVGAGVTKNSSPNRSMSRRAASNRPGAPGSGKT